MKSRPVGKSLDLHLREGDWGLLSDRGDYPQSITGSYVVMAGLWNEPVLQLQLYQVGYGFGALIIPFVSEPFLSRNDTVPGGNLRFAAVSLRENLRTLEITGSNTGWIQIEKNSLCAR